MVQPCILSQIILREIIIISLFSFFLVSPIQGKTIRVKEGNIFYLCKQDNSTYKIAEKIDLQGKTLEIPDNSTLKFTRRGKLVNGNIKGNRTTISGYPSFSKIILSGSFRNESFYASWCDDEILSDYFENVLNLSNTTEIIIDKDVTLSDSKRYVSHLSLRGKNKTITNSDRFFIEYGGSEITDLKFIWNKDPVKTPKDGLHAVIVYHDLLQKDTTITNIIRNVESDGGHYCSFFMRQFKGYEPLPVLQTFNIIENCEFKNFTRGVVWAVGGKGIVRNCVFKDIGYETSDNLYDVMAVRLGFSDKTSQCMVFGCEVTGCTFQNIVAAYNGENDGRGLHGFLAYGDSIVVRNNKFLTLSTSFSKPKDTGMDSEMLYIKGSYNIIENNYFENGAGSRSDGVITLKIGGTERNIVRNNELFTSSNYCIFINIGGCNHIVEGNEITNTYDGPVEGTNCAIVLSHYSWINNPESVKIQNNVFSFSSKSYYLAISAREWGDLVFQNNIINNASRLLKHNRRHGVSIIIGNKMFCNDIHSDKLTTIIALPEGDEHIAEIKNNEFVFSNIETGRIVSGANYCFNNNSITLTNTNLYALLRGQNTFIEALENSIFMSEESIVTIKSIVAEIPSPTIIVKNNIFNMANLKE